MKLRFHTLDVFTDQVFGGNPLAVFPEANGLTKHQMQLIAREFNLSETVFVVDSENPECINRLRIFTPTQEVPFAGHPTVGTAFLLAEIGAIYLESGETTVVFEEGVGQVPVEVRSRHGKPMYTQLTTAVKAQYHDDVPSRDIVAKVLNIDESEFAESECAIQAVSCGFPYLLVELKNMNAVARAQLNRLAWQDHLSSAWASSICFFAREAVLPSSHIHARVFAPGFGVDEDAATGSAASALASSLASQRDSLDASYKWIIEQGFEMKRPSFIETRVEKRNGHVVSVKVGGASVTVSSGEMVVPD